MYICTYVHILKCRRWRCPNFLNTYSMTVGETESPQAEFGLNRIMYVCMYSERSGGEGFEGRGMAEREAVQEAASEDQARTRGLGRALRRRVTACTYSLCIQVCNALKANCLPEWKLVSFLSDSMCKSYIEEQLPARTETCLLTKQIKSQCSAKARRHKTQKRQSKTNSLRSPAN